MQTKPIPAKQLRYWLTRDRNGTFSMFSSTKDEPQMVKGEWFVFGDGMLLFGGGYRDPMASMIPDFVELRPGEFIELQPQGTEA